MACAVAPWDVATDRSSRSAMASSSAGSKEAPVVKVVDVELSSFVPSWFWEPHDVNSAGYRPYSVVAAGNGVVCMCNNTCDLCKSKEERVFATRFCVLNPVTRTSVVLPPGPLGVSVFFQPQRWLKPSATAVSMCRWNNPEKAPGECFGLTCWEVGTCDLAQAQAGEGRCCWSVERSREVPQPQRPYPRGWPPAMEQCGGQTFCYLSGRMHVYTVPPGPATASEVDSEGGIGNCKRRRRVGPADREVDIGNCKRRRLGVGPGLEEAAARPGRRPPVHMLVEVGDAVDGPSVALLGLDPAVIGYKDESVRLVAHGGAILFVAQLMRLPVGGALCTYTSHPELVAGGWRLARCSSSMAWEPVWRLDMLHVKRLLGRHAQAQQQLQAGADVSLLGAFVVHDWLCCDCAFTFDDYKSRPSNFTNFVLGLDLHQQGSDWELLVVDHDAKFYYDVVAPRRKCATLVDLRPDLFLS